jgi:Ca2+:H+ antiporter
MNPLLKEIRRNPVLRLLVFVPVVLVAAKLKPDAHTFLFVLSVLAIVPLTMLLSRATESVAEKAGDAVGGLLNVTRGNLAELVIALAALRAGQYALVKASIAGPIVTNTLFILGASFLLGGLKHHVQEYNRVSARVQVALLFLATVALLIPSVIAQADLAPGAAFSHHLSVGLALLLMVAYGLGMLFSLKTHKEYFKSEDHGEGGEKPWPIGLALGSASQIALFVAPVLVLLSYVVGPTPMDLQFWPGAVVMILVSTLTASLVTNSGRSAWFVGALLIFVYLTFAVTLYLPPPRGA